MGALFHATSGERSLAVHISNNTPERWSDLGWDAPHPASVGVGFVWGFGGPCFDHILRWREFHEPQDAHVWRHLGSVFKG